MTHTLSVLVENKPGVLTRVAGLFARRAFNIESLAVSPGAKEGFARMTITSRGDAQNVDQILKQLGKLIDVVYVTDHRGKAPIEVEIALVKLRANREQRSDILRIAENFESQVVDDAEDTLILRLTGTTAELDDCLAALKPYAIDELIRSGKIVLDSGVSQFAPLLNEAS